MRYLAFLRAINVGGHIVKMDRLRTIFEAAGLSNVSTFIASGNVRFESKKSAGALEALIEKTLLQELGYPVATMVRTPQELVSIVERVETRGMTLDGGTLYIGFLKSAPSASAGKAVAALSNDVDTLRVHGRELYWQCRKTLSQSTIPGGKLEKLLGTPTTLRNVTTVRRLAAPPP